MTHSISPVTGVAALVFLISIVLLLVGVFNYSTTTLQSKDEKQKILDNQRRVLISSIVIATISLTTLLAFYSYRRLHKRNSEQKYNEDILHKLNDNSFDILNKQPVISVANYHRKPSPPVVPSRKGFEPLKRLLRQQQSRLS